MTDNAPLQREPGCARCGYPRKEHSHNGACYGLCGEFVPALKTEASDQERAKAIRLPDWLYFDLGVAEEAGAPTRNFEEITVIIAEALAAVRREATSAERERCASIVRGRIYGGHYRQWLEVGEGNSAEENHLVKHCDALADAILADFRPPGH